MGTRDGLRVLIQQVPDDPEHITQLLRAVRNESDAAHIRADAVVQLLLEAIERDLLRIRFDRLAKKKLLAVVSSTDPNKVRSW